MKRLSITLFALLLSFSVFSQISGPASVCSGATISLSSFSPGGVWSTSNAAVAAVSVYGIVTGGMPGSAVITYGSSSTTITVNAIPAVGFMGTTTLCDGESTALSGMGASSYSWSGGISNGVAFTPTVGTHTYIVTGFSAAGCSNTATATVNVNALPTVSIYEIFALCEGQLTTLSGVGAMSYSWSGGISDGVAFPTLVGTHNYVVTGVSADGCTNTATATVIGNALPTVGAMGGGTICSGATVTLNGTGADTYSWSGGISDGVAFAPTVTNTYTVTGFSAAGCTNTATATVSVNALPTVGAMGGTICFGATVTLNGTGADSYSWSDGVSDGVYFTPPATHTYTVTGTNTATTCTNTAIATVSVNALPAISGILAVCAGATAALLGSPGGGTWSSSGTTIDVGLTTGVVTGVSAGAQSISYTFAGCSAGQTITVNSLPFSYFVIGGGSACLGGPGFEVELSGSDIGINYQLLTDGVPDGAGPSPGPIPGTGVLLDFGAQVEADAGTYIFTILATNTATGCTNNMSGSAPVMINPLPVNYTVTHSSSSYCAGGPGVHLGLSGSNMGINYYLHMGATVIGAPLAGIGGAIDFGLETAAGTYTVVAMNVSTACTVNMAGSAAITVKPLPAVGATGGGTICSGATATLHGTGASSYSWSSGISNGVAFTPVAGTHIYTVTGTASATGCTNTSTAAVVVNALPVVGYAGTATLCPGQSTILNGTGADTYSWTGGISNGVVFTPATTGTHTYTVTGTATATGCTNTAIAVVTVNALPAVGYTGATTLCSGQSTILNGTGASSYSWTGSITNGVAFTPAIGTHIYTVTGTATATGCTNTATAVVTVNALPAVGFTGATTLCAGQSTTLNGTGAGAYSWSGGISNGVAFTPAAGTHTYTVTGTATGCTNTTTATVTVNALPAVYTVTGGGGYCAGGAGVPVGFSGSATGVNYQLYRGATAVGAPLAGTGGSAAFGLEAVAGTYTVIAANATTGCTVNMPGSVPVSIDPLPVVYTVTGGGHYCTGGTGVHVGLSGSQGGINYQLYLGAAPVGAPVTGTGGMPDFGIETVAGAYTVTAANTITGCTSGMAGSVTVSIDPLPAAYTVTGGGSYCAGSTGVPVGLSGSVAGINYQLYIGATAVGTATAGTGGTLNFGLQTAAGAYTVVATSAATGCTSNMTGSVSVTITPLVMPSVSLSASPGTTVCAGTVVTFTATPAGGGSTPAYAWTVDGSAVSSPGLTYSYTPLDGDVVAVTMTSSAACASPATAGSSVTMGISIPAITASASGAACDGSYTLTAAGGVSYSWAPVTGLSCTTCAAPGVTPSATTTYTVTGTNALGCTNTATATLDGNRIMGTVSPVVSGTIRVWLVQFNPIDTSLTALDSAITCTSGGNQYYNFNDPASGNYMVKAYLLGGTPGASGYIPTYGISSPHWDMAATVSHAGATDNMNINMIYGTIPAGSGFIGGYIASGAGKGTTVAAPVPGMLVYLTDAANNVITYTYTDDSGNYSFSNLADGSYIVYPEFFQYFTTPSTGITISGSSETIMNVDFKQHTTSMTITPYDYSTSVKTVVANSMINIFPNPASDGVTIQWKGETTGKAGIVIADIVGREVYNSAINMSTVSGQTQIGLHNIKDGVYIITIKNESTYYSNRLIIAH